MAQARVQIILEGIGAEELIDQLNRTRQAAVTAGSEGAAAFEMFNVVAAHAGEILGMLGVAFSGQAVVEYIKRMGEASHETVLMADRLGFSIDRMQELGAAAEITDVSNQKLTVGISKFDSFIEKAMMGVGANVARLKQLGIKPEDLVGKNTYEQLEILAGALEHVKTNGEKVAALKDIFGRGGVGFGPLLEDLPMIEKRLEDLGLVISGPVMHAGAAATVQFKFMNIEAKQLGQSFSAGFGSEVISTLTEFTGGVKNVSGAMTAFGVGAGWAASMIVDVLVTAFELVMTPARAVYNYLKAIVETVIGFQKGGVTGAWAALGKGIGDAWTDTISAPLQRARDRFAALVKPPNIPTMAGGAGQDELDVPGGSGGARGAHGKPYGPEIPKDRNKEISDLATETERKAAAEQLKIWKAQEESKYKLGRESVEDYYNFMKAAVLDEERIELEALAAERTEALKVLDPQQRRIDLLKIEAKENKAKTDSTVQLIKLDEQRTEALRREADEQAKAFGGAYDGAHKFQQELGGELGKSLTDFLDISKLATDGVGQHFKSLASSVASSISQMIAKMMEAYVWQKFMAASGLAGSLGAGAGSPVGQFALTNMVGTFAGGGVIPKTGLALMHANEVVIDPAAPARGMAALRASGAGQGGDAARAHLHVTHDPAAILEVVGSSAGMRVILQGVNKNRNAITASLGGGR